MSGMLPATAARRLGRWCVALAACLLAATGRADERMIQIEERQLMSWTFGDIDSVSTARKRTEDLLAGRIEFVARVGELNNDQRRKLELAGRGDIVRFFEACDEMFRSLPKGSVPQDEWQQCWQKLQPLRQQFAQGLHEEQSLFRKTVVCTLNQEQLVVLQKLEGERALQHYRALVAATLSILDSTVPLTIAQRTRLTELLMAQPKLPRLKGHAYYQYHFVLYRLTELPEGDVKPLFDDVEWKVLQRVFDQARSMKQMFVQLEAGGQNVFFAF